MSQIVPNSSSENGALGGNTKDPQSIKKQCVPSKNWFFTYNNYEITEIDLIIDIFEKKCEKYLFEHEVGESGTPHLQGFIILKEKGRPTELKLSKKIHWEKCKGSEYDNILYCSKDYREGKTKLIWKSTNIKIPKPLKLIEPTRPFQRLILDIVKEEPDERAIHWFYEEIGNVGKSCICKYLIVKHEAIYLTEGKKSDLMNLVFNALQKSESDLIIVDVPRDNKTVSYKSLEEIKNGMICNTKYETGVKVINPPHIIVFSNFPPDSSKMSKDRWRIYKINEKYEAIKEDIV